MYTALLFFIFQLPGGYRKGAQYVLAGALLIPCQITDCLTADQSEIDCVMSVVLSQLALARICCHRVTVASLRRDQMVWLISTGALIIIRGYYSVIVTYSITLSCKDYLFNDN